MALGLNVRPSTIIHAFNTLGQTGRTNVWVLNKAGIKRELLDTVKARKLAYYGHTMRKQDSCLEKEIMQRTMPGARRRGRPRTAWMDNIKTWTGLSVEVNQNDRGQGQMGKARPWCGQPSDRGRVKNRTEQAVHILEAFEYT